MATDTNQDSDTSIRLNKHLALHMGISRREADEIIDRGDAAINGIPATLGARVHSCDTVVVRGKTIHSNTPHIYVAFNKPEGYVCSRRSQGAPTIYELLPAQYHALKSVGRLDQNSSGLLLLTNDGDFAFHMTHPKFYKTKIYHVTLSQPLQPLHQQMISDYGVMLEDGPSKFVVTRIEDTPNTYEVTMSEGRNRQIRRTFAVLGYEVTGLHRVQFGNYTLGELQPGGYRIAQT